MTGRPDLQNTPAPVCYCLINFIRSRDNCIVINFLVPGKKQLDVGKAQDVLE